MGITIKAILVRGVVAVLALLAAASCTKSPPPAQDAGPEKLLVPEHGAYTGAFIDFGDTEDDVTLEGIEGFESLVGKQQAIIASSSYWGEQSFPTKNLELIWRHGSVPLVFWSPWDRPYDEDQGPDKFSLTNIAAGKWDRYIDQWADAARAFGHPMMVSFANEMNGEWFPWSGMFYGVDKQIPNTNPPKYVAPETFKAAYRRVVDRVRARGAANVIWVFHTMNYSMPQSMGSTYPAAQEWNKTAQYYPGSKYVDWLGMSVYGQQYLEDNWSSFEPLLDWPYTEITEIDPTKPVMLAEWGIGEFPQFGSKSGFITEAFEVMKRYPMLKAAVFWNERWQNEPSENPDGTYQDGSYSNLRVNSSPESLAAFRKGIGEPFWLGRPIIRH